MVVIKLWIQRIDQEVFQRSQCVDGGQVQFLLLLSAQASLQHQSPRRHPFLADSASALALLHKYN